MQFNPVELDGDSRGLRSFRDLVGRPSQTSMCGWPQATSARVDALCVNSGTLEGWKQMPGMGSRDIGDWTVRSDRISKTTQPQ